MKQLSVVFVLIFFMFASCNREKKVVEESYPDGTPKKVCIYKGRGENRQILRQTDYYENGKVKMDGGFRDNLRDGQWVYLYPNGKKWSEGSFRNGKNEGKRTTYFENGQIRYEAWYKDGERVGIWKFYDDKGNLVKEVNYDAARQIQK